jgi:hypothetical protein
VNRSFRAIEKRELNLDEVRVLLDDVIHRHQKPAVMRSDALTAFARAMCRGHFKTPIGITWIELRLVEVWMARLGVPDVD